MSDPSSTYTKFFSLASSSSTLPFNDFLRVAEFFTADAGREYGRGESSVFLSACSIDSEPAPRKALLLVSDGPSLVELDRSIAFMVSSF